MKHYHFTDAERAVLEQKCAEVTRTNTKGLSYFVASTADEDGQGHALMVTDQDGNTTKRWGPVTYHLAELNKAL